MKPWHFHREQLHVREPLPIAKNMNTIQYNGGEKELLILCTYLSNKVMNKSTDTAIFTYRSAFANEEEIQIAQIIIDSTAGNICQWRNFDSITFAQRCL